MRRGVAIGIAATRPGGAHPSRHEEAAAASVLPPGNWNVQSPIDSLLLEAPSQQQSFPPSPRSLDLAATARWLAIPAIQTNDHGRKEATATRSSADERRNPRSFQDRPTLISLRPRRSSDRVLRRRPDLHSAAGRRCRWCLDVADLVRGCCRELPAGSAVPTTWALRSLVLFPLPGYMMARNLARPYQVRPRGRGPDHVQRARTDVRILKSALGTSQNLR